MSHETFLKCKTLIVGDVKSGKTERTLKILRALMNGTKCSITLLDLVPEETKGVGGKIPILPQEKEKIHYLSPKIIPPRLFAKDEATMLKIAKENYCRIRETWGMLESNAPQVLCINDVLSS